MSVTPVSFGVTVSAAKLDAGRYATTAASLFIQPSHATLDTDEATVVTDVATLVSDGASPTQAHVNTLNTDWGALKTALDAYVAASAAALVVASGVTLTFDSTGITSMNQLKSALDALVQQIRGSGLLTA